MKGLFAPQIDLTSKVMNLRLERQNVVMGNLSNIDTPGYKARRLEFETQLQDALALDKRGKVTRTSKNHMPSTFSLDGFDGEQSKAFEPREVYGEDRVDLDKEMVVMNKNAMMYNALAQVIKKNFEGMQKIIQDGAK